MIDEETAEVIASALWSTTPREREDDITTWSADRLDELCLFDAIMRGEEIDELGLNNDADHGINEPEEMEVTYA